MGIGWVKTVPKLSNILRKSYPPQRWAGRLRRPAHLCGYHYGWFGYVFYRCFLLFSTIWAHFRPIQCTSGMMRPYHPKNYPSSLFNPGSGCREHSALRAPNVKSEQRQAGQATAEAQPLGWDQLGPGPTLGPGPAWARAGLGLGLGLLGPGPAPLGPGPAWALI